MSCGDRNVDRSVVEFIIQQILLHHPNGATTEEEGLLLGRNYQEYDRLYGRWRLDRTRQQKQLNAQ